MDNSLINLIFNIVNVFALYNNRVSSILQLLLKDIYLTFIKIETCILDELEVTFLNYNTKKPPGSMATSSSFEQETYDLFLG